MSSSNIIVFPIRRAVPLYQIKVTLVDSKPPIWRRLQLLGTAHLDLFHAAIQVTMGWNNSHMHLFRAQDDITYGDCRLGSKLNKSGLVDEASVSLMQILPKVGSSIVYKYGSGDLWDHVVVVERILPPDDAFKGLVQCVGGARACPPENCGGMGGYERLLEYQKKPKSKAYREHVLEELGGPIDPDRFDLGLCTKAAGRLKWEHPTQKQLQRVTATRKNEKVALEGDTSLKATGRRIKIESRIDS